MMNYVRQFLLGITLDNNIEFDKQNLIMFVQKLTEN